VSRWAKESSEMGEIKGSHWPVLHPAGFHFFS
jgi:hypothetical protein